MCEKEVMDPPSQSEKLQGYSLQANLLPISADNS